MVELPNLYLCLPRVRVREDGGRLDFERLENSAEVKEIMREVGTERIQRKRSSINLSVSQTLRYQDRLVEAQAVRLHVVRNVSVVIRDDLDRRRLRESAAREGDAEIRARDLKRAAVITDRRRN